MVEASLRVFAPAERRNEVLDVLRSLKGPTESAIGCRACRIMQDAEDGDVLTYFVRWDTRDELEEHIRSERFRRLLPYLEMSLATPEVEVCNVEQVGGLELLVTVLGANSPANP